MKTIYRKFQNKGIDFKHVCEVGVYKPVTSNISDFIFDGIKATLVEADSALVPEIETYFAGKNITIHNVAIWDYNGTIKLSKASASTFVSELEASPALVNDGYVVSEEDSFEIPCRIFSDLDDGSIDFLSVDIEGSEWYVIKNLVSRPKVISVETHGKYYTNPFITNILEWMEANDYQIWYKDNSDTVFVKSDVFTPDMSDKWALGYKNFRIELRKMKRHFKK